MEPDPLRERRIQATDNLLLQCFLWCLSISQSTHHALIQLLFPYPLVCPSLSFQFRDKKTEAQGFCDVPGSTQLSWRPHSASLSFSGITLRRPPSPFLSTSSIQPRAALPSGDAWQHLGVLFAVTTDGGAQCGTGAQWLQVKDAAQPLVGHRQPPQRSTWCQMQQCRQAVVRIRRKLQPPGASRAPVPSDGLGLCPVAAIRATVQNALWQWPSVPCGVSCRTRSASAGADVCYNL